MKRSSQTGTRIAVFGGAFDPPHQAHVFAVTTLLMRPDISEVWLLPTHQHVFDKQMTDFDTRCEWLDTCVRAAGWSDEVSICKIERDLGGQSRTFDTLTVLEKTFPDHNFCFVIGADNLAVSDKWYRFVDLVANWPLIVFGRPGFERVLEERKHEEWCLPEVCLPALSSTSVRDGLSVESSRSLRQVPPPIRDAVRKHFTRDFSTSVQSTPRIHILGLGRVGSCLIQNLRQCGYRVLGWSKGQEPLSSWLASNAPQEGDVFILTVPDQAIVQLAKTLSASLDASHILIHCAGMLPPVAISPLLATHTGVMHPIRSIADKDTDLAQTHWGVFGGTSARRCIETMVDRLSGRMFAVDPAHQQLYHAAMVIVGNLPVALLACAEMIMTQVGVDAVEIRDALLALLGSAYDNLKEHETRSALTGPIARHDLATVEKHLVALDEMDPQTAQLYRLASIRLAKLVEWESGCSSLTTVGPKRSRL
jgi:nicotinate-nucleotide adenylyltransferase